MYTAIAVPPVAKHTVWLEKMKMACAQSKSLIRPRCYSKQQPFTQQH